MNPGNTSGVFRLQEINEAVEKRALSRVDGPWSESFVYKYILHFHYERSALS